jgi:uncharacterized membrane protein
MTRVGARPALIVISCVAVALVYWLGAAQPVRGTVTLWFFLVCPGLALVGLARITDRLAEAVLAVALSLALSTGVAVVMGLTDAWSTDAALAILLGISLLGAAFQVGASPADGAGAVREDGRTPAAMSGSAARE